MISDKQWQQDMMDGVNAAFGGHRVVGHENLCASIKKSIHHLRMQRDTQRRTGGKCPTQRGYLQRQYEALAGAFERLTKKINQSRR